jgi:Tfp pilus assembly protein PilX
MVVMLLIFFLGMSALNTTTVELQISGNDKINKQTFYQADGGIELGSRMVEENIACPTGFAASTIDNGNIVVRSQAFWQASAAALTDPTLVAPDFGDADNDGVDDNGDVLDDRAFYYTPSSGVITNFIIAGTTQYNPGSAIQMTSGYEGKGKGAAAGGAAINFDIIAQGRGAQRSVSELEIIWRHAIGQEGECNY